MGANIASRRTIRVKSDGNDVLNRAWWYQLREHNRTKKIYDIDPFIEVYRFRDNFYGLLSDNLDNENGYVWMYLVVGPEKALLVDTSFGLGNLKGLVNEISGGKPIIVVNSHCSCDHSYGNCQFERAYGHIDLADDMNWKQNPGIWDYLFDEKGKSIWCEFDRKDMIAFKKYEFTGVPDGYVFNLGDDYDIELVWLPGHQPGHAGYLDRKGRILIAGDAITGGGVSLSGGSDFYADAKHAKDRFQGSTIPSEDKRRTVTAYRDGLIRLARRLDDFDYIFGGHETNDLDSAIVLKLIEACDWIIANPTKCDYKTGNRWNKMIRGYGAIMYYPNGI
jgi:glyoxylase-like metal-dependent hydrolase (beta-lactamase superfamily II)